MLLLRLSECSSSPSFIELETEVVEGCERARGLGLVAPDEIQHILGQSTQVGFFLNLGRVKLYPFLDLVATICCRCLTSIVLDVT